MNRGSVKRIVVVFAAIASFLLCHKIYVTMSNAEDKNARMLEQGVGHLKHIPLLLDLKTRESRGENSITNDLIRKTMESPHTLENIYSAKGMDYLSRIRTSCRNRTCPEFLMDVDSPHYKYCIKKTWNTTVKKFTEPLLSTCSFINGLQMYPMGIASYPGSGNTWVRGLLQEVTGLCTGSIYCDVTLRKNGFVGESIRSGVTFLVKSHQTDPRWEGVEYSLQVPFTYFKRLRDVPVYSGGVFILRNPFHAIVAEFQRIAWKMSPDHHIKRLGREHFGKCICMYQSLCIIL